MPRRFRLTGDKEVLWLPVDLDANISSPVARNFFGLGRVAPSVRRESQQALADTIADRLQADHPLSDSWNLKLTKKKVAYVNDTARKALFVLLGAVGFVLMITCANTAHLFLSQVAVRQREMAVRTAIGAPRARLLRGVLIESVPACRLWRGAWPVVRHVGHRRHPGGSTTELHVLRDDADRARSSGACRQRSDLAGHRRRVRAGSSHSRVTARASTRF